MKAVVCRSISQCVTSIYVILCLLYFGILHVYFLTGSGYDTCATVFESVKEYIELTLL